jgi:hypothetical protein
MSRRTVSFSISGSTSRTQTFLKRVMQQELYSGLDSLAQRGVTALKGQTPTESGLTGASWSYEIEVKKGAVTITWTNSNVVDGANVAILLQYGHGTGTGGYVSGRDYINPALQPIFDEIAEAVWKKVTSA